MTARAAWIAAPGWLKILVVLSLIANLVFAGMAVGVALRAKEWRAGGGPVSIRALVRALPEDKAGEIREKLETARRDARELRKERSRARRRVLDEIARPTLDRDALAAAFDEMRAKSNEYRAMTHRLMVDIIASLSDEERRALAKRLREERLRRQRERPEERRKRE